MKRSKYLHIALVALTSFATMSFTGCKDQPDEYKSTSGKPEVQYIRLPQSADSIITKSYLQKTICLVGKNLRSIHKILFNDQQAVLNTSFITDNTLLVDIPKNIPSAVTDKIYMINGAGDTTTYDFHVIVPPPVVSSMSCEYAVAGDEVTVTGDYFIQDPYKPLQITFNDGELPVTEIKSISKNSLTFIVPVGATSGRVSVESVYGKSKSQFVYKDTRNILFDFDGSHGGLTAGHGWRPGRIRNNGIDGSYLYLGGANMLGKVDATWDEDDFAMNYWPEPSAGFPELSSITSFKELLDTCDINDMALKFECRVPASSPWSASALQMIFTGNNNVTFQTANSQYYNADIPRGLWLPWQNSGSFNTGSHWTTVTIPLSAFNKTYEGQAAGKTITKDMLTGFTFFLWSGGIEGTDCTPELDIDNVRVVPIK